MASVVITVGDQDIFPEDVALARERNSWWSDNLVSFFIEHIRLKADCASICFIPPSLTLLIGCADRSDIALQLEPLQLLSKRLVVFALNSASSMSAADLALATAPVGSHWSLLVYSSPERSFFHYDSIESSPNEELGRRIALSVRPFVAAPVLEKSKGFFVSLPTPLQQNSYDCGPFCCGIMQQLSHSSFLEGCEKSVRDVHLDVGKCQAVRDVMLAILS